MTTTDGAARDGRREEPVGFAFPFAVDPAGRVGAAGGDPAIRGEILQVLFTAPGERVHLPQFGCGLFDLVFEPNNDILAAAAEFSIGQALTRWLGDRIVVDAVGVEARQERVTIEIAYTKRADLSRQAVRVHFR
jgi:hypothetical protein